ncbi:MAG: hypothetical protein OEM96_10565, partial [Gemmatimonadota bacterium]|nr:hypothetical protein [Gemmatimonadota bacterium]
DLTPASASELASSFAGTRVETVSRTDDWPSSAFTARRGAEATPWLLAAIALLLLAELVLAAPERAVGDFGAGGRSTASSDREWTGGA